jgi:ribonuclease HI
MSTEVIYTDGACSKNGLPTSVGGFGIYIAKSQVFEAPVKMNRKGERMHLNHEKFYVTNIRMEGLAIVSILALYCKKVIGNGTDLTDPVDILNSFDVFETVGYKVIYGASELKTSLAGTKPSIEIITDSQFWINVIEKWMPNWIIKGVVLEKKNPDILLMFRYYLEMLKQNGIKVKFTFVRSHQKGKRTVHADGNDVADVLATSAVQNPTNAFYLQ